MKTTPCTTPLAGFAEKFPEAEVVQLVRDLPQEEVRGRVRITDAAGWLNGPRPDALCLAMGDYEVSSRCHRALAFGLLSARSGRSFIRQAVPLSDHFPPIPP